MSEFTGTERFAVRRRLGSGSFGVVYEAFDSERQAVVALKLPHESSAQGLYLFKQEFRSLADVTHPNLACLYELMTDGDSWFFSMEYVDGVTFFDYLHGTSDCGDNPSTASGPTIQGDHHHAGPSYPMQTWDSVGTARFRNEVFSPYIPDSSESNDELSDLPPPTPPPDFDRVRSTIYQLAEGLAAIHNAGKLHRDLKPSNVLVTEDGRVVILDFGLVADAEPNDEFSGGQVAGTPAYMAPEQIDGNTGTEASDWYSVGVMLYQVITGRLPFPGNRRSQLTMKLQRDPIPPKHLIPQVPPDLNDLCMLLLRRSPQARPTGPQILEFFGTGKPLAQALPSRKDYAASNLIGREAELQSLFEAFATAKNGTAITAFIHGDSGLGKSFLVRCFLQEIQRMDSNVVRLHGRCYEQESVPFRALDSLVDALSQYLKYLPPQIVESLLPPRIQSLARLFPVLQQIPQIQKTSDGSEVPDPQELRRRAFGALRELLRRMATRFPLVLVIDDLQWGDLDSAVLLEEVLRAPDPPPLLLLACYRGEEAETSPVLQELLSRRNEVFGTTMDLELRELTHSQSKSMAASILGSGFQNQEEHADWIAKESGGNPFFIEELARFLRHGGTEQREGAERHLDDYIRIRLEALQQDSRILLETLSIAGYPLDLDLLHKACRVGSDGIIALNHLRSGHLIRIRAGSRRKVVETYHDRIRAAVSNSVSDTRTRDLHLNLAEALEQSGSSDGQALARHFEGAGRIGKAAMYAAQAGDQSAAALAFDHAASMYRKAIELRLAADAEAPSLWKRLGDALANAGRSSEAAEAYLRAMEGVPETEANRLQRRAAEEYLRSGNIDAGVATLERVLAGVGVKLAPSSTWAILSIIWHRLRLWLRGLEYTERSQDQIPKEQLERVDIFWAVAMGLGPVDVYRGADYQTRQLLLTLNAGEPFRVVRALAHEMIFVASRGNRSIEETQRLQSMTLDLAERIGQPNPRSRAFLGAGIAAEMQGRWKAATELLEQAEETLKQHCTGMDYELHIAQSHGLICHHIMGDLQRLQDRLPALLQEAREQGDLMSATTLRTSLSPYLTLAQNDPDRARQDLETAIQAWSRKSFHLQHYHHLISHVSIDLYAGHADQARQRLLDEWTPLRKASLLEIQVSRITAFELRARCALGMASQSSNPKTMQSLLREADKFVRRIRAEKTAYGEALSLKLSGHRAMLLDQREIAKGTFFQAELAFDGCDMTLHSAAVRYARGVLQGQAGRETTRSAEAFMRSQGIADPHRYSAMHVPYLDDL